MPEKQYKTLSKMPFMRCERIPKSHSGDKTGVNKPKTLFECPYLT